MNQALATMMGAAITGAAALTVGVLAYIFGRVQKEHEVRFTRLYERRAAVTAKLYRLLKELSGGFETWRSHHNAKEVTEREQQHEYTGEKLNELLACYTNEDIWLSPKAW